MSWLERFKTGDIFLEKRNSYLEVVVTWRLQGWNITKRKRLRRKCFPVSSTQISNASISFYTLMLKKSDVNSWFANLLTTILPCRDQSIDLQGKLIDWVLYDKKIEYW